MPCLREEAGLQQLSEAGEQGRKRAVNVHSDVPHSSPLRSGRWVPSQCLGNAAFKCLPCNSTKKGRHSPACTPKCCISAVSTRSLTWCGSQRCCMWCPVVPALGAGATVRVVRTRPSQPQSCFHRAAMPCQPKLPMKTAPRLSAPYKPAEAHDATSTKSNLQHGTASNRV